MQLIANKLNNDDDDDGDDDNNDNENDNDDLMSDKREMESDQKWGDAGKQSGE